MIENAAKIIFSILFANMISSKRSYSISFKKMKIYYWINISKIRYNLSFCFNHHLFPSTKFKEWCIVLIVSSRFYEHITAAFWQKFLDKTIYYTHDQLEI